MSLLITIEGIDGSGKTTLLKNLAKKAELDLITCNWRDTQTGQKVWQEIIEQGNSLSNQKRISAFLTAFASLNEEIIKPNLQQNKIIIIDRYLDSTLVYQGAANAADFNEVLGMASQRAIPWPDLTFILDLDPQAAQKRLWKRKMENGKYANWDQLDLHFHARIRNQYLQLKQIFPERAIRVVNAAQEEETLAEEVISIIKENASN